MVSGMAQAKKSRAGAMTPKQQRFVHEYLRDHNGTQAAIRAGYSDKTDKQQGSRLLSEPRIQAAVRPGQNKVAKKAEVTVDSLMAELEQARKLALKEGQASAAVTATMGKVKLSDLLVEKHKHSGGVGIYDLKNLSDNDLYRLEQILGQLADAGGDSSGASEEGG